ncbi:peptidoglycan-binding domain-containing protein [Nannocystis punicea]|uniref:Peptidoglycan-binding domain-containing protein n=1 Tax=Nannocystis punicea TaxID=2995304 RepID=A0ABY7HK24_9BACT|nr:peptidoglycan-binding domain-containing protein [Nannocystis poenicansa]WAS99289.1 peptidoglycan-binding domain-containing protein [Nannocystis poenicansa]
MTVRAESLDLSLREVLFLLDRGIRAVQADHGLVSDGIVGPRTRAVLDELFRAPAGLPRGKGMFVRSVKHLGSIAAMQAQVAQVGLRWLAFQCIWQYENKQSQVWSGFTGHAKALRAAGQACWVWGFPWPGREAEFVEVLLSSATSSGASGVLVDAEAPYVGAPEAAARLMAALLPAARAAGLAVGLTSYGAPWNFPRFPWAAFTGVDFAVPQIYDIDNNQGSGYPQRSIAAYRSLGFSRVVPACPTFAKTAAQLAALHASVSPPDGAAIWWDWYNSTQNPFTWNHVRDFELP